MEISFPRLSIIDTFPFLMFLRSSRGDLLVVLTAKSLRIRSDRSNIWTNTAAALLETYLVRSRTNSVCVFYPTAIVYAIEVFNSRTVHALSSHDFILFANAHVQYYLRIP